MASATAARMAKSLAALLPLLLWPAALRSEPQASPATPCAQPLASPAVIRPVDGWYAIPRADLPDTMDVQREPGGWRVADHRSGAVVEVDEGDLQLNDHEFRVRQQPRVRVLQPARDPADRLDAPSVAAKKNCPEIFGCSHLTYCIGLVQVCCSTGKVIGVCLGAWDCGCPFPH